MGNQRCMKRTMADVTGKGKGGSVSECHNGRQEEMPPNLCGLKVADGWEGIVNTAFYGDTLMRLIYRVLLRVDFVELLQLYFL